MPVLVTKPAKVPAAVTVPLVAVGFAIVEVASIVAPAPTGAISNGPAPVISKTAAPSLITVLPSTRTFTLIGDAVVPSDNVLFA